MLPDNFGVVVVGLQHRCRKYKIYYTGPRKELEDIFYNGYGCIEFGYGNCNLYYFLEAFRVYELRKVK